MASYARAPALQSSKNQMPTMLVQAKPAVISSNGNGYNDDVAGILSEKINSTLRFAPDTKQQELGFTDVRFNYTNQKAVKHIEDELVLQKQNVSNQMRQAAVMAAVASQQKVRLSAKERLALTAKRPMTNQQINDQQPPKQTTNCSFNSQSSQSATDATIQSTNKQTSLPTLETLLAVQRQLQQHTKQNLNSLPQQVVNHYDQNKSETNGSSKISSVSFLPQSNKPLPPSPLRSPSPIKQIDHQHQDTETYDKDLPPLPESISPSTSTDDSQLNSLESHQSSPATSLVSIPPPPPPISSYLEQYDEVNHACQQSNRSISSSPSTISSTSDVSSVKKFPATLQIKQAPERQAPNKSADFELPLPYFERTLKDSYENSTNSKNPTSICKPPVQLPPMSTVKKEVLPIQQAPKTYRALSNSQRLINNLHSRNASAVQQQQLTTKQSTPTDQILPPPPPPLLQKPDLEKRFNVTHTYENQPQNMGNTVKSYIKPQIDYKQHLFTSQQPSNTQFIPPPPPPLTDPGFDEPDCGSIRFPTPPPPDLLLPEADDGIEDEDDFQCKIPTPPPNKSISATSFNPADFGCQERNNYNSSAPLFNSSTFTAKSASLVEALQPPPLFRQQQHRRNHQQANIQTRSEKPPQLTVRIGDSEGGGGLLSTAINSNHHALHHQSTNHHIHHHNMMMAMTASSSSPSSSSDGDGHSTNSSSSTSGIHSSIDSPSSSSSKLVDDFNYTCKIKKLASNHLTSYRESHQQHKKNNSSITNGSLQPSPVLTNTVANPPPSTQATAIRPALKQKKTVSFSDKVELVACADEQSEDHLPNPLLARVLAGKLQ